MGLFKRSHREIWQPIVFTAWPACGNDFVGGDALPMLVEADDNRKRAPALYPGAAKGGRDGARRRHRPPVDQSQQLRKVEGVLWQAAHIPRLQACLLYT